MLKPEQVPMEVVEAYLEAVQHGCGAREVMARAIDAWPKVGLSTHVDEGRRIILPLPTEASDEHSV